AGAYTVTLNSPITVSNLTMNGVGAGLNISTATLNIVNSTMLTAGVIQLSSGTIAGGTITTTGGRIQPNASAVNFLSGVSVAVGALDMATVVSRLQLAGGTNFSGAGTLTLGPTSSIYLSETVTLTQGVNFTLASSSLLSADGFTATL